MITNIKWFNKIEIEDWITAIFSLFAITLFLIFISLMVYNISPNLITPFFIMFIILINLLLFILREKNYARALFMLEILLSIILPLFSWFFINIKLIIPDLTHLIVFLIILVVVIEIFFFLDKRKPENKKEIMIFTIKRKIESLIEAILLIIPSSTLYYLLKEYNIFERIKQSFIELYIYLKEILPSLLNFIGHCLLIILHCLLIILITAAIIGIIYCYIKLNSLRYEKKRWK